MKKVFTLVAAICFVGFSAFAQQPASVAANKTKGVIKVNKETHDFGKVPKGIPVSYEFEVENVGTEAFEITDVQKVCGCTVTNWTKGPIAPGQKGTVTAQYNAAREGKFKKPITIMSNASNAPIKLYFEGEVMLDGQSSGAPEQPNIMTAPNNN